MASGVRTWPFRVYSFPSQIVLPRASFVAPQPMMFPGLLPSLVDNPSDLLYLMSHAGLGIGPGPHSAKLFRYTQDLLGEERKAVVNTLAALVPDAPGRAYCTTGGSGLAASNSCNQLLPPDPRQNHQMQPWERIAFKIP